MREGEGVTGVRAVGADGMLISMMGGNPDSGTVVRARWRRGIYALSRRASEKLRNISPHTDVDWL